MNLITQTVYDYWRRGKVKMAPSGWLSRNAPCCSYRGQNPDKKGRGGLKIDSQTEAVAVHCFNCSFTCSYQPGKPLYPKMVSLLQWLNVDENLINQLKLESLRLSKDSGYEPAKHIRRDVKEIQMPTCSLLELEIETHRKHVDFLKTRGFEPHDFPFLVSPDLTYRSRIILPFILHDTIIGYSARSIVAEEKTRYIMKMTTDFVFGMEWVEPEHEWVFVAEGLLDALSVKCLGVMHNEISEAQAEMICDLQKRVIVVPDLDKAGLSQQNNSLIGVALDNGWSVAFPEWGAKDINAAYVKYGSLFVVKHLLETSTDQSLMIRAKQKILLSQLGKKTKF
jgi:hypothetical protein